MDNDFEMWKFTTSQNVQDQCFNVETASPKNYFDLMFNPDMTGNIVRNTNNYVRWIMDQKAIYQR